MTRPIGSVVCALAAGAFVLLAGPTIAGAQEPAPEPMTAPTPQTSPAETPPAAAPEPTAAPPSDATAPSAGAATTDPAGCKGLAEHPCRKNKACVWIIPKEIDKKTGQVRPAYCHKHGTAKKKTAKKAKATAPGAAAAPPAPPAAEPPSPSGTSPY